MQNKRGIFSFKLGNETGQSLLEAIIAISVGILVVTALTIATIFSIRNAQFAKNSAQATKLAQAGMEQVRTLRDRDTAGSVVYIKPDTSQTSKFSDLWAISFSCPSNCYFYFDGATLRGGSGVTFETQNITPFKRQVVIEDVIANQKKITVVVNWTDFSGIHESRITTILGKI